MSMQLATARPTRKRMPVSGLFEPGILSRATIDAFLKLNPVTLARNPVIFTTAVVALLSSVVFVRDLFQGGNAAFVGQIAFWLWFTVLFANFAEAVAEGRGKAQAATLRRARTETMAKRLNDA